ncbi:MAG TPA: sulfocyanin-like copper-binding protein [Gemmatimonadaceae bacterium]
MTAARALAVLSLVLLAAGCREGEQSSAEAARADSSAAGYDVGPAPDGAVAGSRTPVSESLLAAARLDSARTAARRDSLERESVRRDSVARALALRDSVRRDSVARDSTRRLALRDSALHASQSAHTAMQQHPPRPTGPVRVNEFLTYDASSRTASVQLIAGYNGVNGSLNYNGAIRGQRTVAIPVGWHVHVTVTNHDSDLQHSAIVVREVLPPPLELTTPAFEGAALPRLDEGLQEDETGTLDFDADHAGRFMLACGVPGHAQSGLWLRLVVARGLSVPDYR